MTALLDTLFKTAMARIRGWSVACGTLFNAITASTG
jgi:hypothetical protein